MPGKAAPHISHRAWFDAEASGQDRVWLCAGADDPDRRPVEFASRTAVGVFGGRDGFQMVRVHTRGLSAQMVKVQTVGHGAVCSLVKNAVRLARCSIGMDVWVALVRFAARPYPTWRFIAHVPHSIQREPTIMARQIAEGLTGTDAHMAVCSLGETGGATASALAIPQRRRIHRGKPPCGWALLLRETPHIATRRHEKTPLWSSPPQHYKYNTR